MGIPWAGIWKVPLEGCQADLREAREGCDWQKVTHSPWLCLLVGSDSLESDILGQ